MLDGKQLDLFTTHKYIVKFTQTNAFGRTRLSSTVIESIDYANTRLLFKSSFPDTDSVHYEIISISILLHKA